MPQTTDEKLAALDTKLLQLKAQKQQLLARQKQSAKKARIARLIKIGELVEQHFGEEATYPDNFAKVLEALQNEKSP